MLNMGDADKRLAFLDWVRDHRDVKYFRNRITDHIIVVHRLGNSSCTRWSDPGQRGSVVGTLVFGDKWGRLPGMTVTFNYLDTVPLTEMELIAWAAKEHPGERSLLDNSAS